MPLTLKPATGSGQMTLISVAGTTTNDTLTFPAKTGNVITSADSGTVSASMLSTGAPSWTSGGVLSFNSGYGSTADAYGCRAWVNFNGVTTATIRASANVSSVTRIGTGNYSVSFTSAMPDANYSVVTSGNRDNVSATNDSKTSPYSLGTSSVNVICIANGAGITYYDFQYVLVAVFR